MICIAESGSTKTDWVVVGQDSVYEFKTIGFNPFFIDSETVAKNITESIPFEITSNISSVHFYGAGCSDPARNQIIEEGIYKVIPNASIEVEHDLLAAARSVCLNQRGIACILGTGSNSCFFDGQRIIDNVTALGYVLGDEGGGVALGKALIKSFVYRELPEELTETLKGDFNVDKEYILNGIYNRTMPNRYLASFAPFYSRNRNHPFIQKLLAENFREFIVRQVLKYDRRAGEKVGFVGSIACTFESEIRQQLDENNLEAGDFVKKPIQRLVKFHTKLP